MVTLTVDKLDPTVMKEPEPKRGIYNGVAQDLIEPGSAANGTMMYSLEKDGEYLPASPARANVDTYVVWYKVVGDENYNDLGPFSVEAAIQPYLVSVAPEAMTYNGTQSFTVVLDGVHNETVVATLKPYSRDAGIYEYAADAGEGKYTVELSSGNYAVERGDTLIINKLQAMLVWKHPLVFIHDNKPHEVTAAVSNAIEGDAVELIYQTDFANKITNSATDVGDYNAVVERLGNDNYTLNGVQNTSQRWYIIEKNENYVLSADRSEEIVYGDVLNLTFVISPDALREYPGGHVVFFVNDEAIGNPDNISENAGGMVATRTVKITSANNFSAGANTVTAIYSDNENDPHGFDAVSVRGIPKPIKAEITGDVTKPYDGNAVAANLVLGLIGVEDCDEKAVTIAADSFTYNSQNVNEATTITANQVALSGARSGNYALTTPVETAGRMTAKVVRLEWSGFEGLVYTGNPVNVTAVATELIPGDQCGVIVADDGREINAGSYHATALRLDNANYALPEEREQPYTIEPMALHIPEQSVVYNGTNRLTVENLPVGVENEAVTVMLVASAADVGVYAYGSGEQSYTATVTNTNYRIVGGGMLHITPATPAVVWPSVDKIVYVNDLPLTLGDLSGGSATGVNNVSLNGDFIIDQGALRSWDSSGAYLFQVVFKPESANYINVTGSMLIVVDKRIVASVEPQAAITDKQYGTELMDLSLPTAVTITTADGKTFENVPVIWSGYHPYTLTEQTLTGTLDLRGIAQEVENPQNLTVSIMVKLLWLNAETVDFPDKAATYSGSPIRHGIDGNITGVAGISYTYEGKDGTVYGPSSSAPTNAGTYAVTAVFAMESGYPQINAMTVTLTINQAPFFITEQIVTYNGTTRFVVYDVPTGINDEKITFTIITTSADVGEYIYGRGAWTYTASITDPNYIIMGGKRLTIIAPEHQTGGLTVRKQVTGENGDRQAEFAFMVMLSDTNVSGTYGNMVFNNGVATFMLKHDESITATGLPAGVRYSVVEQTANQDGYVTTTVNESGVITADTTVLAVFVNARDTADIPGTGDDSHIEWWLALMGISVWALIAAGFGLTRKKRQ